MVISARPESYKISLPRVGQQAPPFLAVGDSLSLTMDDFLGKWLVLFSQPSGCTPSVLAEYVDSIEIYHELRKLGVAVLGLRVDAHSPEMDLFYNLPREMGVSTPQVITGAVSREVALAYGRTWMSDDCEPGRCVYIIDDCGIVKAVLYYPLPANGRMHEVLKIMAGLRTAFNSVVTADIWKAPSYG